MTLPLIHLLEQSSAEEARRIRDMLAAAGNHKREALAPVLMASGAIRYARRRAEDFAARAAAELECLCPSEHRSILEMLTDRVVHRET
jgi:octaprenyl-diphosphate synthase